MTMRMPIRQITETDPIHAALNACRSLGSDAPLVQARAVFVKTAIEKGS